jgi:hypothetical protein
MSKDTVIRIGGPAMILGGVLWMVANLGHLPMEWFGGINFDVVWGVVFPPLFIGLYVLTVYAGRSRLMRAGAWLAFAASVVGYLAVLGALVGMLGPDMLQVWMGSLLFLVLGMLLFAMGALREKPLPRWNGVAVVLIILLLAPFLSFIAAAVILAQGPPPQTTPDTATVVGLVGFFGLIGLCWLLLGYAMLPLKRRVASAQS